MKLVLLGAPGSGKGTQAARICEEFNIPHISTGAMLREQHLNNPEHNKELHERVAHGELVPDELINEMVSERIREADCKNGFLFDGYPRTNAQAVYLDSLCPVDAVVRLEVPMDLIMDRICGRRVCSECGENYHISALTAIGSEDTCPKCGGRITTRKDDNPDTVKRRLEVYAEQTQPLVGYYAAQGKLIEVAADGRPEDITREIFKLLRELT